MPITPQEVLVKQEDIELTEAEKIPDFVYDCFDKLIATNYSGSSKQSFVYQKDVVSLIEKHHTIDFHWSWLNVESKYRSLGWDVQYFKAPYYETGSSYFVFSVKL